MPEDNNPNMKAVERKLIAEINEKGLGHVLRWIGVWYDRAAEAELADQLKMSLGERHADPEARELFLLDRMLPAAEGNTNFSTSAGHNLFNQALIAAAAREINAMNDYDAKSSGPAPATSRSGRAARWDAWRAKQSAQQAVKP